MRDVMRVLGGTRVRAVRVAERLEESVFDLLLCAFPPAMRARHSAEMRDVFVCMRRAVIDRGAGARLVLWLRILADVVRSAPVERWRERRSRPVPCAAPDWRGALLAGAGVLLLYLFTLSPTTAFWDAGEYITVAHVLGIPHPPGNPLFVMLARSWDALLSFTGWPVAVRINVFGAVCSAAAHTYLYLIVVRGLAAAGPVVCRVGASCAVLLSATAFTVWHQSNVNEKVYTLSFLTTTLVMWLALRWRDTRNPKLLVSAAYVIALSATNHLMGVIVSPAVLLFVWRVDRRVLVNRAVLAAALPAVVLALSVQLFLPLRAAQRPVVNEPDPVCESLGAAATSIYTNGARGCPALSAALTREQYAKPSVLSDPNFPDEPRGGALLLGQFVNYLQYFDWQWARSIAGGDPLFGGIRPLVTALIVLLIAIGARTHFRYDRNGALLFALALLLFSAGLVLYLNFRWGYAIAREAYPDPALHEVRERDYFFLIGFSLWGAWAGLGIAAVWNGVRERAVRLSTGMPTSVRRRAPHALAAPVLLLALVPFALNRDWADRADDWTARDWAYNVLMSVGPYGVLVTNGDNDSFPLWYVQHVEGIREDVTVVLSPYLAFPSYARQIRDLSRPCGAGIDPESDRTRITCQRTLRPGSLHPRLIAAWNGLPAAPPEDSILPLDDAEIDRIAADWFITDRALGLRAGDIHTTIPAGTLITPMDTFVAAIVNAAYGRRPIHFMAPSTSVEKLGLGGHTVRTGLTWKLREPDDPALVPMAPAERDVLGAFVDLPLTDTLARDVFIVRGRVADPRRPWVDHTTRSVPTQYAAMHHAAARASTRTGNLEDVDWHARRMDWWYQR